MALKRRPSEFRKWAFTFSGSILMAVAYNLFLIPNEIAPGGLTGVAQLINSLTGLSVGLMVAILNVPLLILGWRARGRNFMLRTVLAIAITSVLIDVVRFPDVVYELFAGETLLATVYGDVLTGGGIGLAILGDATTGGVDLIAMIIHTKRPQFKVAWIMYAIDGLVVFATIFIYGPVMALYALVALFISSKIIDVMQTGILSAKALHVISNKSIEIKNFIINNLERSATVLKGVGAYRNEEIDVLLCVVSSRQVHEMRTLIRQVDPNAFVIISDVKEVEGEGFTR